MSTGTRSFGWLGMRQSAGFVAGYTLHLSRLLDAWSERRRQRVALLELSDHMLKDIGIGRGEAYREGTKPFWRN